MKWNQFRVSQVGGEGEVREGTFFPRDFILSSCYTSRAECHHSGVGLQQHLVTARDMSIVKVDV